MKTDAELKAEWLEKNKVTKCPPANQIVPQHMDAYTGISLGVGCYWKSPRY